MKKLLLALVILFALSGVSFAAKTAEDIINSSVAVLHEISSQKDSSSMADTIKSSHAIAIIPSMVKAGLLIGGEYGEGLILVRKDGKWYGPSFYNIGGGSFGLQLGAQEVSLLLAVTNERGVNAFLSSRTKLGADVGITAGPVGRNAEAATDAQAKASIYSYSMSKGLFAGISLDGSVISISVKRNKEYWGDKVTAAEAVEKPAEDKRIKPLLKTLDELIEKAK